MWSGDVTPKQTAKQPFVSCVQGCHQCLLSLCVALLAWDRVLLPLKWADTTQISSRGGRGTAWQHTRAVEDHTKDAWGTASYWITHQAFLPSAWPKVVSKKLTGRIGWGLTCSSGGEPISSPLLCCRHPSWPRAGFNDCLLHCLLAVKWDGHETQSWGNICFI